GRDWVASGGEVVDGAAVVLGVDDRGRFGGEPGQILVDGKAGNIRIARQEGLQCHRRSGLAGADKSAGQFENTLVNGFEEVLGFEKIRDAVERLVIDEDGAEQSLFGLDIVRRRPERRLRGRLLAGGRIENWHGSGQSNRALWPICGTSQQFGDSSLSIGYSTSRFTQQRQRLCVRVTLAPSIVEPANNGSVDWGFPPLP